MKNATIQSLIGNKHKVTIEWVTKIIDLDGMTVISNEDYELLADAWLDRDDRLIAPMHSDWDEHREAAAEQVSHYNWFDIKKYIAENSTD